jgi:hypothetical protein
VTDPGGPARRLRAYLNARPKAVALGNAVEYGPEYDTANGRPAGVYALDRADLEEVLDELAELRNALNWGTPCRSCARVLDGSIADQERAEKAEAQRDQLAIELAAARAGFAPAPEGITVTYTRAISDHTYEGQPDDGNRCETDLFGQVCDALWEQHRLRETGEETP